MELFIKYPIEVQQEIFLKNLSKAKNTEWGKRYDFNSISTYEEFTNRIPLQNYESIKQDIFRIKAGEQNILWPTEIKWFAKSSGTTSDKSKFIPVSKESLFDCHYKGGKDLLSIYYHNRPDSKLFSGKTLIVGGSAQINELSTDSYYGDLSAIIIKNLPYWVENRRTPDRSIAIMDGWEEKLNKMVITTSREDVTNISGVPSWTIVLLNRILEYTGKNNIHEVWPNLELFMHGGVNFKPYENQFKELIPSKRMDYFETYNASEGFFGIQDQLYSKEMLLMLDYGIFYEFIPMEELDNEHPKTITLENVEMGKTYALVINTNGGLWRYQMGDTITFTSLSPYRIKVCGRTEHFINVFGEELMITNADNAIAMACKLSDAQINDYTVAPVFLGKNGKGGHEWLIEFKKEPQNLEAFGTILDDSLKTLNSDYEAKRSGDLIMTKPIIRKMGKGSFYEWLKKRNKVGGQHKVPKLKNDRSIVDDLLQHNEHY